MPNDKICYSQAPETYEVLATFCMIRGYVEFDYKRLPECKAKVNENAPSRIAAANSTITLEPLEKVRGFLDDAPKMTKDGNFIITLRNMNRRDAGVEVDGATGEILGESYFIDKSNAQTDGSRKIGFVEGEYLYRSYRLDVRGDGKGLQLATAKANINGKKALFPNVQPILEVVPI